MPICRRQPPPRSCQFPPPKILNQGQAAPLDCTDTHSRVGRADASVETVISRSVPRPKSVDVRCESESLRSAMERVVVDEAVVVVGRAVVVVELVAVVDIGRIVVVVVVDIVRIVVVVGPIPTGVALPVGRGFWMARLFTCEIAGRSSGT